MKLSDSFGFQSWLVMRITLARILVQWPLVWLAATAMGWLGLFLMYWGTPFVPVLGEFWTNYVVVASILIWSVASLILQHRQRSVWLLFGAFSPLLGALLVAPPASFAFVIVKGYIAFPIGFITGWLMYYLSRIDFPRKLPAGQSDSTVA